MKPPLYAGTKPLRADFVPDGGVDLSQSPEEIADNQSAGLCNFWFDRGALRLRPGLRRGIELGYGPVLDIYPRDGRPFLLRRITQGGQVTDEKYGFYIATRNAILACDGESVERVPSTASFDGNAWSYTYTDYNFDSCSFQPGAASEYEKQDSQEQLWSAQGDCAYLIGGGYFLVISAYVFSWPYPADELSCIGGNFAGLKVPYVPTLMVDARPDGTGTAQQSRNLLTPVVCESFTADSASTVYRLFDTSIDDAPVSVVYTDPLQKRTLSFLYNAGDASASQAGMTAMLDRAAGSLTFSSAPAGGTGVKNNITVTYRKTVYPDDPVRHCRVGGWYGAQSSARLFLSGCGGSANSIFVSAPGDPSYFPEESTLAAGDPADPVTAMGKLFDILVILKRSGIYAVEGDETLTVKLVHDGAGCDVPGSVQPFGNTLAFADTAHGIYLLRSTQIRDERAVLRVSQPVAPAYAALDSQALSHACAATDGRHYFLFAGGTAFVMDGGEADLSTVSGNTKLPLYLWKLPAVPGAAFLLGNAPAFFSADGSALFRFDSAAAADDGVPFEAFWQSKAFDFGVMECLKRAVGLFVAFAGEEGAQVTVRCGPSAEDEKLLELNSEQNDVQYAGALRRIEPPRAWQQSLSLRVARAPGNAAAFGIGRVTLLAVTGALCR